MKWELELWDCAGSQGLDTWYDLRDDGGGDAPRPSPEAAETSEGEPEGA